MPEKPFHAARNRLLLRDRPFAKNRLYFAPMGLDLCDASGTPGDGNHPARDAGVFRRRWYCGP
ncbi:hypothetical protein, partial [Acetobacter estunensis]|uniref:hypothetical protein n=1 Tax=Acetobacter estunensis TaxID=104097 RepID=UPI00222EFF5D